MPEVIKLRKGLNIKLKGKAEKKLEKLPVPTTVALKPTDFPGLTPKLSVKVNHEVKAGDPLFYDKYHPEIVFTAPLGGKVISIKSTDEKLIPSGAYKIIPAMQQGGIKINLLNLESRIAYALTPSQVLEYADNVLEHDSTFKQSDLNISFEEEDLSDLKTDYSEIFSNFSNNMTEFADTSSEALAQEIFKELNKCK